MAKCKNKSFCPFKDRDTNECYAKLPCSSKTMTNYGRIQNMSIEELADFLSTVKYDGIYYHEGQEYPMQAAVWEDWLQAESEE